MAMLDLRSPSRAAESRPVRRDRAGPAAAACLALATVLSGQEPAPTPTSTPPQWVTVDVYSEGASRAAFRACDRDADDRLSIFEAAAALPSIASPRDLGPFRRLDSDVDGFLSWPEFDRRFRELLQNGNPLRFHPARRFEAPEKATGKAPENGLLPLFDRDGDGVVKVDELKAMLASVGLPARAIAQAAKVDIDGSGDLSPQELRRLAPLVPKLRAAPSEKGGERLPDGYRQGDANGDGVLDKGELSAVLRRLHPSLVRWTARILRDADRTGNGTLGPIEIVRAQRAPIATDGGKRRQK